MLKSGLRRITTTFGGKKEKEEKKAVPNGKCGGRVWRTARDPKTGRVYYYDVVTRETQWSKPIELMDESEQAEVAKQEAEKKAFFEDMEANMRMCFDEGLTSVDVPKRGIGWRPTSGSIGSLSDSRYVRTLSTMDDSILGLVRESSMRPPSTGRSLSPPPRNMMRILEHRDQGPRWAKRSSSGLPRESPRVNRNSTGTVFLDTTLDAPDRDATIRCVCHVVRAHIASAKDNRKEAPGFEVFHDPDAPSRPPSLKALVTFYRDVFSRGQMEVECIVTSLIYVERLLKAARGRFRLRPSNWRPVLVSCMIMASKVCDDLSMWNADFSHICQTFDLQRINALEAALLRAYGFNATVSASEYAKYYFHLRSMAARLGLAGPDLQSTPLDIKAAKALADRSRRRFPEGKQGKDDDGLASDAAPVRRVQSVGTEATPLGGGAAAKKPRPAILEQIVDMGPSASPPH